MEIKQLKDLLNGYNDNLRFEYDLKKKTGLILEENQSYFI